jgi:hypothetical protein
MAWDDETNQRLEAVHTKHRAMGTRPRPDANVTIPTPSVVVADSLGEASGGPAPERVAPIAGHADSARRRR